MFGPMADARSLLEKLGATFDDDSVATLPFAALEVESVFGEPPAGDAVVSLFSPEAFGFTEPPELVAIGPLWIAGLDQPAQVKSAIRDAHRRLSGAIETDRQALIAMGFEPSLKPPEPQVRGTGVVAGHSLVVTIENAALHLLRADGAPIPAEQRKVMNETKDATAETVQAELGKKIKSLIDEGILQPSKGLFAVHTVRAPMPEEPSDAAKGAADADAPSDPPPVDKEGTKKKAVRPRRKSRLRSQSAEASSVLDQGAAAPDADAQSEAPADDVEDASAAKGASLSALGLASDDLDSSADGDAVEDANAPDPDALLPQIISNSSDVASEQDASAIAPDDANEVGARDAGESPASDDDDEQEMSGAADESPAEAEDDNDESALGAGDASSEGADASASDADNASSDVDSERSSEASDAPANAANDRSPDADNPASPDEPASPSKAENDARDDDTPPKKSAASDAESATDAADGRKGRKTAPRPRRHIAALVEAGELPSETELVDLDLDSSGEDGDGPPDASSREEAADPAAAPESGDDNAPADEEASKEDVSVEASANDASERDSSEDASSEEASSEDGDDASSEDGDEASSEDGAASGEGGDSDKAFSDDGAQNDDGGAPPPAEDDVDSNEGAAVEAALAGDDQEGDAKTPDNPQASSGQPDMAQIWQSAKSASELGSAPFDDVTGGVDVSRTSGGLKAPSFADADAPIGHGKANDEEDVSVDVDIEGAFSRVEGDDDEHADDELAEDEHADDEHADDDAPAPSAANAGDASAAEDAAFAEVAKGEGEVDEDRDADAAPDAPGDGAIDEDERASIVEETASGFDDSESPSPAPSPHEAKTRMVAAFSISSAGFGSEIETRAGASRIESKEQPSDDAEMRASAKATPSLADRARNAAASQDANGNAPDDESSLVDEVALEEAALAAANAAAAGGDASLLDEDALVAAALAEADSADAMAIAAAESPAAQAPSEEDSAEDASFDVDLEVDLSSMEEEPPSEFDVADNQEPPSQPTGEVEPQFDFGIADDDTELRPEREPEAKRRNIDGPASTFASAPDFERPTASIPAGIVAEHDPFQSLASVVGEGISTGKTGAIALDADAFAALRGENSTEEDRRREEILALRKDAEEFEARARELRDKADRLEKSLATRATSPKPTRSLADRVRKQRTEGERPAKDVVAAIAGEDAVSLSAVEAALVDPKEVESTVLAPAANFSSLALRDDDDDDSVFGHSPPADAAGNADDGGFSESEANATRVGGPSIVDALRERGDDADVDANAPSPKAETADAVAIIVTDARVQGPLAEFLAPKLSHLSFHVDAPSAEADYLVYVHPSKDDALIDAIATIGATPEAPRVLILSNDESWAQVAGVDHRVDLGARASEVASQVLLGLKELGYPSLA